MVSMHDEMRTGHYKWLIVEGAILLTIGWFEKLAGRCRISRQLVCRAEGAAQFSV
jgi:hypothetical protein